MKKSIIFFSLAFSILALMAFGWVNWNETNNAAVSEFNFGVDSRYGTTITKEDLIKARSVLDIVPKKAEGWWKMDFQTVTVAVLQDGGDIQEIGYAKELNAAQLKILKSTDYSSGFYIQARGKTKHPETEQIVNYTYHLTVVPEKEAEYPGGQDALIAYLSENSKEEVAIVKAGQLQRGEISFKVSTTGTIMDVELVSSSGYKAIDKTMVTLMKTLSEKWDPATKLNGDKIEQEFIFSFGRGGC